MLFKFIYLPFAILYLPKAVAFDLRRKRFVFLNYEKLLQLISFYDFGGMGDRKILTDFLFIFFYFTYVSQVQVFCHIVYRKKNQYFSSHFFLVCNYCSFINNKNTQYMPVYVNKCAQPLCLLYYHSLNPTFLFLLLIYGLKYIINIHSKYCKLLVQCAFKYTGKFQVIVCCTNKVFQCFFPYIIVCVENSFS